jgi:hypothetical protein
MYLLYESGILMARWLLPEKIAEQQQAADGAPD